MSFIVDSGFSLYTTGNIGAYFSNTWGYFLFLHELKNKLNITLFLSILFHCILIITIINCPQIFPYLGSAMWILFCHLSLSRAKFFYQSMSMPLKYFLETCVLIYLGPHLTKWWANLIFSTLNSCIKCQSILHYHIIIYTSKMGTFLPSQK